MPEPTVVHWSGVLELGAPPITGTYVRLVPLSPVHDIDLFTTVARPTDDDLWTYRPTDRPTDPGAMRAEILRAMSAPTLAMVPVETPVAGRPAGIASYLRIDPVNGSVEIGSILLGRDLKRTRSATEALHLMMAHAFESGYRRLEWKCDARNEASRAAARRLGFRYEGRFANHMVVKGRNRDTDWFSITDEEWPEVDDAHQAWLSGDNFDDDGAQRTSLSALTAHMVDSRLT